jgi:hypothetical protein
MYARSATAPNVARGLWNWSAAGASPTVVDIMQGDTAGTGPNDNVLDADFGP